jgi:hypothetical protein
MSLDLVEKVSLDMVEVSLDMVEKMSGKIF